MDAAPRARVAVEAAERIGEYSRHVWQQSDRAPRGGGSPPLLTDVLIGAGAGAIVGKLVSTRLERRRGADLDARRIRQLGIAWTLAGVAFALLANAVIALHRAIMRAMPRLAFHRLRPDRRHRGDRRDW